MSLDDQHGIELTQVKIRSNDICERKDTDNSVLGFFLVTNDGS